MLFFNEDVLLLSMKIFSNVVDVFWGLFINAVFETVDFVVLELFCLNSDSINSIYTRIVL